MCDKIFQTERKGKPQSYNNKVILDNTQRDISKRGWGMGGEGVEWGSIIFWIVALNKSQQKMKSQF